MNVDVLRPRSLALLAKSARMGLDIDAKEADRLSLSFDVIEAVLSESAFAGWDGFSVVVQAYGQRAGHAIDRRIMVRLFKRAYWDTEIKRAQVAGIDGFPVFTSKAATDISYIANARKLLSMTDRINPQFATHNAHTGAAILEMGADKSAYEFQRLHGMGESLHDLIMQSEGTRCRFHAPVGAHRCLLACLVGRLLENGTNSSFSTRSSTRRSPAVRSWPSTTRSLTCPPGRSSSSRNGAIPRGSTCATYRHSTRSRRRARERAAGKAAARAQKQAVEALGGVAVAATGRVEPEALVSLTGLSGALWWGDATKSRAYAAALSQRDGPILPLITGAPDTGHALHERHVCVDSSAAGGNAALLSGMS
jgi:hypothetical protein